MQEIVENRFDIEPEIATQYIRGTLYLHIHAILMWNKECSPEMAEFFAEVLQKYIDFFLEYLKIIPEFLEEYSEGLKIKNDLLYLVNRKIAVTECYYELLDLTGFIFSGENGKTSNNLYKVRFFNILH